MYNVETLRSRAGEKEFTAGQTLMRRMLARESRRTKEECTYLVAGEGGGSKRDKAAKLGIPIIGEDELNTLLEGGQL